MKKFEKEIEEIKRIEKDNSDTTKYIWETCYDVEDYIDKQIQYFTNNKQEFLVDILWDEEKNPSDVTDEEIEDHFLYDQYIHTYHWEFFKDDLYEEFKQFIGKTISVEGRNMGWMNRSGHKEFVLTDTMQIFSDIAPDCDLTFYITKEKEGEYEIRLHTHDSPMGEYYEITIKDNEESKPQPLLYSETNKIK